MLFSTLSTSIWATLAPQYLQLHSGKTFIDNSPEKSRSQTGLPQNHFMGRHKKFAFGKKSDAKFIKTIGNYTLMGVVGEGASSLVRLAAAPSSEVFAVKIVPKVSLANKSAIHQFQTEIKIMRRLKHPGVVEMSDFLKDSLFYYVVMEYLPGESLWERISRKRKLPVEEARAILQQLVSALSYMHSNNICHCDLKPENILFTEDGKCKIVDFGLSTFCDKGPCHGPKGTIGYMSPEALSGNPYDGRPSDIWSLGIVLYTMVVGKLPWSSHNPKQVSGQIKRGRFDIPTHLGPDVERILKGTLTMNPEKRMTIQDLANDEWIANSEVLFLPDHKRMRERAHTTVTKREDWEWEFGKAMDVMRREREESDTETDINIDKAIERITNTVLRRTHSAPVSNVCQKLSRTQTLVMVKCTRTVKTTKVSQGQKSHKEVPA